MKQAAKSALSSPKADMLINRFYFVLMPVLLGLTLWGLVVSIQSANNTKKILEETRHIAEQNQQLAKSSQAYIRCIADLFIGDETLKLTDLDTCAIEQQERSDETLSTSQEESATIQREGQTDAQGRNGSTNSQPRPQQQQQQQEATTTPPPQSILPGDQPPVVGCTDLTETTQVCL